MSDLIPGNIVEAESFKAGKQLYGMAASCISLAPLLKFSTRAIVRAAVNSSATCGGKNASSQKFESGQNQTADMRA